MEPWWTSQQAGLIGGIAGTGAGIIGAVVGTLGSLCVPRGKCKPLVLSLMAVSVVIGVACLITGLVAVSQGQPYHVWYPLSILGLVLTVVFGALLPVINAQYRQADMRRLEAEELRRS